MKILCVSNSTTGGYGYSQVFKNVLRGLRDNSHEVWNVGMQSVGNSHFDELGNINLPVRFDLFTADILGDYCKDLEPDIVLTGFDIWVPSGQAIVNFLLNNNIQWICQATINSDVIHSALLEKIKFANSVVSPSIYGLNVLRNHGLGQISSYIPHGFDENKFYPEDKEKLKKEYGLEDKFVFLTVQRNRWLQKNNQGLLIAYRKFLNMTPGATEKTKLFVLTDLYEPDAGLAIFNVRAMLGLQNNVEFIKQRVKGKRTIFHRENDEKAFFACANFKFDEDEMRKIYNIADCYVTSSYGESFSLPTLESQACGVPQIFPRHTTGIELVKNTGSGLLCDIQEPFMTSVVQYIYPINTDSMASCMKKMFLDDEFRKKCSENALQNTKQYEWKKLVPVWNDLIKLSEQNMLKVDFNRGILGI